MPGYLSYASVAIVDWQVGGSMSIEAISIQKQECSLSGAWHLAAGEIPILESILDGKLVVNIGGEPNPNVVNDKPSRLVDLDSFLASAQEEGLKTMAAYESFKSEDPKKRNKLVAPSIWDWPRQSNLNKARETLSQMGKQPKIEGTAPEMEKVLTASRLLKMYIDHWLSDELERQSRNYTRGDESDIRLLPPVWLQHFHDLDFSLAEDEILWQ